MHIRFAEADQNFISAQAQHGFYSNETEVVRDAVRRLREQREAQQSPLYKAVMKGHDQIEQGLTVPLTPELTQEIRKAAVGKAPSSEPVVCDPAIIAPDDL